MKQASQSAKAEQGEGLFECHSRLLRGRQVDIKGSSGDAGDVTWDTTRVGGVGGGRRTKV